jgi:flagellin
VALGLYTNTLARRALYDLAATTSAVTTAAAHLSSGIRVRDAFDDAVGIGTADGLRHARRVTARAMRNATDGVAMLSVADAALAQVGGLLDRMAELASAAATTTIPPGGRAALQTEFAGLIDEIARIATGTQWNGLAVVGAAASFEIQVGPDGDAASRTTIVTEDVGPATLFGGTLPSIATAAAAAAAVAAMATAAASVTGARSRLGAATAGLLATIETLGLGTESLAAAERRIRDADVAVETAEFSRARIREATELALLAQANLSPARVLQLLR